MPTLIQASVQLSEDRWSALAQMQIDYFLPIQKPSGAFPDMTGKNTYIFDTAQVLFGLCALLKYHPAKIKPAIERAYDWLLYNLTDEGVFSAHNYISGYHPSYYSRVFWAMISAETALGYPHNTKITTGLNAIVKKQQDNGILLDWSLHPDQPALTHVIGYTLRGLYECGCLLNQPAFIRSSGQSLLRLVEAMIRQNGKLAGSYDDTWYGDNSFVCTTGNAQLALLCMKFSRTLPDMDLPDITSAMINPLLDFQEKDSPFYPHGSISSSLPFWGKYQRFKVTNWTMKFYVDCLLELLRT